MERYKCRFCFKSFINGRALGGHMRSHMLCLSSKRELYDEEEGEEQPPRELSDDDTELDASSSSDEEEKEKLDKLKRDRVQMVDDDEVEFDFSDDESETESSRINPTRRRSKRTRKLGSFDFDFKTSQLVEPVTETEHHSSVSDTTTEEDLAFCLIMLSRDKWKQQRKDKKTIKQTVEEEDDETEHDECEDYKSSKNRGGGGGRDKFKCETCGRVFKSYQALGGHRASHKKNKTFTTSIKTEHEKTEYDNGVRVHECPICFRVFSSGQALGGHKRSHGSNNIVSGRGRLLSVNQIVKEEEEEEVVKQRMIDLNLPAPNEDDETSVVVDEW